MKAEILPPLSATLHVKPAGWRFGIRLWLPLFLLWLLLLPLLILALPLLFVASLIFRVKLWRALRAANGVLAALHGTSVEVDNRDTNVSIHLH
jgi:hypothetical protein